MGFGLPEALLCVFGAILLLVPFLKRRRFREMVLRWPSIGAWMAKRRPDLTEQVVTMYTVAWVFGVVALVAIIWSLIRF